MPNPTISRKALFAKLGYEPHGVEQWNAHLVPHRFKIPCCGRRWGKTTFAANEMTYHAFEPDSVFWIVGKTYAVGEREFKIIYDNFIRKMPEIAATKGFKASYNVKQGDMRIQLPWNTVIEVKSADKPDGMLGEGLSGVIFSEAATHEPKIWSQFIQPALSDKRGWCIFPSTPRGYNWYHGLWLLGQDNDIDTREYISWTFPTWANLAAYPGGFDDPELAQIRSNVSKTYWDQEYAAKFTAYEGQIYEEFDRQIHIQDIEYDPLQKNFMSLDFGFVDPFVALDIMVYPDDRVHVWREYQVSGMTTWQHGQYLTNPYNPDGYRENPRNYHVDGIFADPRGLDQIKTLEPMMGPIRADSVPWENGIETIKRWMKLRDDGLPALTIHPRCTNLIRQIEQLRHKEGREGKNSTLMGQHDYDDHGPDALRYFFGPYFFLRLDSHLSDVYGGARKQSESEIFFRLHKGVTRDGSFTTF